VLDLERNTLVLDTAWINNAPIRRLQLERCVIGGLTINGVSFSELTNPGGELIVTPRNTANIGTLRQTCAFLKRAYDLSPSRTVPTGSACLRTPEDESALHQEADDTEEDVDTELRGEDIPIQP
jgi:hypothetical protein